jgi:DNA-binding XRE family transcriptional regulator
MYINGILIKRRRKEQHITQNQLAKSAACTQPVICQLENGCYHHKINLVVIENVCKILMLDINQVVKSKKAMKLCKFHDIELHDVLNNHEEFYKVLIEIKPVIKHIRDRARYNFLLGVIVLLRHDYQAAITRLNKACGYYAELFGMEIDNFISLISSSNIYITKGNYNLLQIGLEKFMELSKLMEKHKTNYNDITIMCILVEMLSAKFKITKMED